MTLRWWYAGLAVAAAVVIFAGLALRDGTSPDESRGAATRELPSTPSVGRADRPIREPGSAALAPAGETGSASAIGEAEGEIPVVEQPEDLEGESPSDDSARQEIASQRPYGAPGGDLGAAEVSGDRSAPLLGGGGGGSSSASAAAVPDAGAPAAPRAPAPAPSEPDAETPGPPANQPTGPVGPPPPDLSGTPPDQRARVLEVEAKRIADQAKTARDLVAGSSSQE
jgi:hypothetical protein